MSEMWHCLQLFTDMTVTTRFSAAKELHKVAASSESWRYVNKTTNATAHTTVWTTWCNAPDESAIQCLLWYKPFSWLLKLSTSSTSISALERSSLSSSTASSSWAQVMIPCISLAGWMHTKHNDYHHSTGRYNRHTCATWQIKFPTVHAFRSHLHIKRQNTDYQSKWYCSATIPCCGHLGGHCTKG